MFENYYWLYKHFMIFDVDKNLNVYLIFMSLAPIADNYAITRNRLRNILAFANPIERERASKSLAERGIVQKGGSGVRGPSRGGLGDANGVPKGALSFNVESG